MLPSSAKLKASNPSTNKSFLGLHFRDQLKLSTCFLPLHWDFYLQLLGSGLLKVWSTIIQGEGTWDNWRETPSVESRLRRAWPRPPCFLPRARLPWTCGTWRSGHRSRKGAAPRPGGSAPGRWSKGWWLTTYTGRAPLEGLLLRLLFCKTFHSRLG